ncbi:hypothetical protein JCM10213_006318 [Rhodosporidiobolus nylandii]
MGTFTDRDQADLFSLVPNCKVFRSRRVPLLVDEKGDRKRPTPALPSALSTYHLAPFSKIRQQRRCTAYGTYDHDYEYSECEGSDNSELSWEEDELERKRSVVPSYTPLPAESTLFRAVFSSSIITTLVMRDYRPAFSSSFTSSLQPSLRLISLDLGQTLISRDLLAWFTAASLESGTLRRLRLWEVQGKDIDAGIAELIGGAAAGRLTSLTTLTLGRGAYNRELFDVLPLTLVRLTVPLTRDQAEDTPKSDSSGIEDEDKSPAPPRQIPTAHRRMEIRELFQLLAPRLLDLQVLYVYHSKFSPPSSLVEYPPRSEDEAKSGRWALREVSFGDIDAKSHGIPDVLWETAKTLFKAILRSPNQPTVDRITRMSSLRDLVLEGNRNSWEIRDDHTSSFDRFFFRLTTADITTISLSAGLRIPLGTIVSALPVLREADLNTFYLTGVIVTNSPGYSASTGVSRDLHPSWRSPEQIDMLVDHCAELEIDLSIDGCPVSTPGDVWRLLMRTKSSW